MVQKDSLRRFTRLASRASLIIVLWLGSVFGFQILNSLHILPTMLTSHVEADGPINVWWPTDNAKVGDTQTFKAMVQDKNANEYTMTWSVDDGQQNSMYDSSTDYPHKEAVVNLSSWNWHGSGPYKVTFTATGNDGSALGQTSVTIFTPGPAQGPVNVEVGTSTTSNLTAAVSNALTSLTSVKTAVASESNPEFSVAFPEDNATLNGIQQFKATVSGMLIDKYNVYWQVDNGQLNQFNTASSDKEVPVDVSGWTWKDNGPYTLKFIAKDLSGNEIGSITRTIYTRSGPEAIQSSSSNDSQATTKTVVAGDDSNKTTQNSGSNSIGGIKFYVDSNSPAAQAVKSLQANRPQDAYQLSKIASNSSAIWLGNWSNIGQDVGNAVNNAKSQDTVPVFVAYNIPLRDCGQYSSGGSNSVSGYNAWIQSIASTIGSNKAIVILEPDALSLNSCLNESQMNDRYSMLSNAVNTLKSKGNISVYLDAGHPNWISADDMASRLNKAGVGQANGFALNVSNFYTTNDNVSYGSDISSKIGGKHFVIDTSRNGVGPTSDQQWCNPAGRALGPQPTTSTGNSLVDAYLWIKTPGESDGNCNGGPNAGNWWLDNALDLARHAAF